MDVSMLSQGFTGPQIWGLWPQNIGLDPKISDAVFGKISHDISHVPNKVSQDILK